MKKFEPGKIYFTKLMTDNCLDPASLKVKVLSRTEKTVKVLFLTPTIDGKRIKTFRISTSSYPMEECFYPFGRYTMAPIIFASRVY